MQNKQAMRFIAPQHPKSSINPTPQNIRKILGLGWVAQTKINGRRAQIHITKTDFAAYTRQGSPHTQPIPKELQDALRKFFLFGNSIILDAEWLPSQKTIFVFDLIALSGKPLKDLGFEDRHALLPKDFIHPQIKILPIIRTEKECVKELARTEPFIEGLVFKSTSSKGWPDSAIVRARKKKP